MAKNYKKVGATKFVERNEKKETKPKKTLQVNRRSDGTYESFKRIGFISKFTLNDIGDELYNLENYIINLQNKIKQEKSIIEKNNLKKDCNTYKNQFMALRKYLNTKAIFKPKY